MVGGARKSRGETAFISGERRRVNSYISGRKGRVFVSRYFSNRRENFPSQPIARPTVTTTSAKVPPSDRARSRRTATRRRRSLALTQGQTARRKDAFRSICSL